jgi:SET domain-containing protein
MDKIIKQDWISPKIEIRETSGKGKGMFAVKPIGVGEKILIWDVKYVNKNEAEKAKADGKLVMQWDDNLFTIENRGDDLGYFINHSCDSNVWMLDISTLIARRDIKTDEELTADYVLWEADEDYVSKWECGCGSHVCRKRVTGKDWRLLQLQERYKDHFSPLINKRIANLKK